MRAPTPVSIISGFLGSGKTTLLNKILKENHGKKLAVLINEFGEIGLDSALINAPGDFVEMDNGCLCCALNADLLETLQKLKERGGFDAVILETTGIADPLPIAWTFLRESLGDFYRISSLVAVVDAFHFENMIQLATEVREQIHHSDFIYLSKTDLCLPNQRDEVIGALKKINPNARHLEGNIIDWLPILFDPDDPSSLAPETHHHHGNFLARSISLDQKSVALETMEDFFEQLPYEVFRAKATFFDPKRKAYFIIHSVCGRVDFAEMDGKPSRCAAVFIGKQFDPDLLEEKFLTSITK